MKNIVITGGAGFIGLNLVSALENEGCYSITVVDNFSANSPAALEGLRNCETIKCDLDDLEKLKEIFVNKDIIFHLAANSDISLSAKNTFLDVRQTTLNTYNVMEAMRCSGVPMIVYSSGSGVYGELGLEAPNEDYGPLKPVSLYGATKLSAEAMISSFSSLFDINAFIFRFANVVGPLQTHGVSYDFVNKLRKNSNELNVLGNGWQSKSYVHVSDVIKAINIAITSDFKGLNVFNIASGDYITVRQIANIVLEEMGLTSASVNYEDSSIGWPGDVPVVRFNDDKIRSLGWYNNFDSEAGVRDAVSSQLSRGL